MKAPVSSFVAVVWLVLTACGVVSANPDTLFVAEREDHSPHMAINPAGSPVLTWIATAPDTNVAGRFDELVIATHDGTSWGAPQVIAGPGNYYTPRTVFASDGARWTIWADHDGQDSQIFCQRELGAATQTFEIGDPVQPDLEPGICSDDSGGVVVVWQGWRTDDYEILMTTGDASGFAAATVISECANSDREPDVVWGAGKAWITWSAYQNMPYNLILKTYDGVSLSPAIQVTDHARSRAMTPYLAWDDENSLLWISYFYVNRAWNGYNKNEVGGSYDRGSPRVLAFDGTTLFEPAGIDSTGRYPIKTMPELGFEVYQYGSAPMLDRWGSDVNVVSTNGRRVWFFHKQIGTITEFGAPNRYWAIVGLSYAGGSWSPPDAFLDLRSSIGWEQPAVAVTGNKMWVAWTADDRTTPINPVMSVFGEDLNLVAQSVTVDTTDAGPPGLVSIGSPPPVTPCVVDVRPPYTIQHDGVTKTLVFGGTHRHSLDLSWDAYDDPPFKECMFYSLDFIGLDWVVPTDHNGRYSKAVWAWIPKWAQIFDVPGRFRVFAGWERSMRGPTSAGGDQNAIFRDPADFNEAAADFPSQVSWHDMYAAMAGVDVLSIPHTSAQIGAVVDWDHLAQGDPSTLPAPLRLVEVYQSARESFEYPGCPLEFPGNKTVADSGWVNVALAMGMRLGLIASSDHTVRVGYACVYAQDRTRDSIWQGLYDRHTFGSSRATRFNADFRVNGALMGSEIVSATAPSLQIAVQGTDSLATIEVNKDGNPSWFVTGSANADTVLTYIDPDPVTPGTSSFYYLRVQDSGGNVMWTSPVWVDFVDPVAAPTAGTEVETLSLAAFPNPAWGPVGFSLAGLGEHGGRLNIYDVAGRLVRRMRVSGGSSRASVEWDGCNQDGHSCRGVFFAVLQSRGESRTTRFVKIR